MAGERLPILSYGTFVNRPRPLAHLRAVYPYCGGLALGCVFSVLAMTTSPQVWFSFGDLTMMAILLLAYAVIAAGYTLAALAVIGWFLSRPLATRRPPISALAGFACPVVAVTSIGVTEYMEILTNRPTVSVVGLLTTVIVCALLTLATPFFLLASPGTEEVGVARRLRHRTIWTGIFAVTFVYFAIAAVGRWMLKSAFDRLCQQSVVWVKANHPKPGIYNGQTFPAAQRMLSRSSRFGAVVVPDGRVLLWIPRTRDFRGPTAGVVYASAPIQAAEIGKDSKGYTRFHFKGMSMLCITRELDNQDFIVETKS